MSEVIVITSGKGGVGKTTTTANIGTGLAQLNKRNFGAVNKFQTEEEILRRNLKAKPMAEYDNISSSAYLRSKEDYLMQNLACFVFEIWILQLNDTRQSGTWLLC